MFANDLYANVYKSFFVNLLIITPIWKQMPLNIVVLSLCTLFSVISYDFMSKSLNLSSAESNLLLNPFIEVFFLPSFLPSFLSFFLSYLLIFLNQVLKFGYCIFQFQNFFLELFKKKYLLYLYSLQVLEKFLI